MLTYDAFLHEVQRRKRATQSADADWNRLLSK